MSFNLNPSGAYRWVKCAGSIRLLSRTLPQEDKFYAKEGIAAENVAYNMLLGQKLESNDPDMIEGAQLLCDTVLKVCSDIDRLIVQGQVACPSIAKNVRGSPDIYFFDRDKNEIHIFDYKYGHVFVDAFENWQLICYAAGVLSNTNWKPGAKVVLWIIQPRNYNYAGPVRSWVVTPDSLEPYFKTLRDAAIAANAEDSKCTTGPHCYRCHASHACDSLKAAGMSAIDLIDESFYDLQSCSIGFYLSLVNESIDRLKALQLGLTEDIKYRIKTGERVDGFTLEKSYTNIKWNKPESELLEIGNMFGINLKSQKLVTPTQAEKLGFPIAGFSCRSEKTPDLVSTQKLLSHITVDNLTQ